MILIRNGSVFTNPAASEHPMIETFLDSLEASSVRLTPGIELSKIKPHINRLRTIEIEFPGFADGRGFSIAKQLRSVLGYTGDLIASGPLIPDQYSLAMQCGFNAISVDPLTFKNQSEANWRSAMDSFSLTYQKGYAVPNGPAQNVFAARAAKRASTLAGQYKGLSAQKALEKALRQDFKGSIALTSSLGIDSAVLLHLISRIDPTTPILFLDTQKHFDETLAYRDLLIDQLGLTNFQNITPDPKKVQEMDSQGDLNLSDKDACCTLRKVWPLDGRIGAYKARITGRKRYQTPQRANMEILEPGNGQFTLNPLAFWTAKDVTAYIHKHDLPPHPLLAFGYLSVGCKPCTTTVSEDEDPRAGRWRSTDKNECGIHFIDGKWVRLKEPPSTLGDYI